MSEGIKFLTRAIWMLHSDKVDSKILYLSRINGEENGWYFWLKDVVGAYGLEFSRLISVDAETEVSEFSLKYYPGLDEDVVDNFSIREQLLRYSENFDNTLIVIQQDAGEESECPYCGVKKETENENIHENCECSCVNEEKRCKGIPVFGERDKIKPEDFEIAKIVLTLKNQELKKVELKTKSEYVDYVLEDFFLPESNGEKTQVLAANDIDRCVPGFILSKPFYEFFIKEFLVKANNFSVNEKIIKKQGSVFYKIYKEGLLEDVVKEFSAKDVNEFNIANEY